MKFLIVVMLVAAVLSVATFGAGAKDVAEGHLQDRAAVLEAAMNY